MTIFSRFVLQTNVYELTRTSTHFRLAIKLHYTQKLQEMKQAFAKPKKSFFNKQLTICKFRGLGRMVSPEDL